MFKMPIRKRLLLLTLTVAVGGLIAAACGTDDGPGSSSSRIQPISDIFLRYECITPCARNNSASRAKIPTAPWNRTMNPTMKVTAARD